MKRHTSPLILMILFLVGCAVGIENSSQEVMATQTATISDQLITSSPTFVSQLETFLTPTVTTTSGVSQTHESEIVSTTLPTLTFSPTATSYPQCLSSEPQLVESTDLAKGLVLQATGEKATQGIGVIGDLGLADLLSLPPYPNDNSYMTVSPDGKSGAFITFHELGNGGENNYSIDILVREFNNETEFQISYNNIALSPYSQIDWVNQTQILIPLKNEGEQYQWLVWSPFTGADDKLSVDLTGIGGKVAELRWAPMPDPHMELITYACELCNEAEYQTKDMKSGEIVWSIDLGPLLGTEHLGPISWSPNGEYFAVSQALNPTSGEKEVWIFNRLGDKLYSVPLLDVDGTVGGGLKSWSPDSQRLLTSRNVVMENGTNTMALSYINMESGEIIDICLDIFVTSPIWSPDSRRFAFSEQIQASEQPQMISIVEIQSGHITQLYDPDAYNIIGWISIEE